MTDGTPLAGWRVLVTRPAHQADDLGDALGARGAAVIAIPTIRIEDPPDPAPLERAAAKLASYDWIVLTSANGARRLAAAVDRADGSLDAFRRARIAVIGPATRDAVRDVGGVAAVMPDSFRAEGLARALLEAGRGLEGARVLLARAREARPVLPERLRAAGATVEVVPAYVTRVAREGAPELARLLDEDRVDWVTFTASSTVRAWVELVGPRTGSARVAAIGPVTAGTAREVGLRVDVVAREYSTAGLVDALVAAAGDPSGAVRP